MTTTYEGIALDLLANRTVSRLLRSAWFPLIPQLALLAAFIVLVVHGWSVNTSDPGFAKTLRNTNLANLLVWCYWWPVMVVVPVLLGRVWCMVCPMELVTSAASRVGLKLRFPKFLRNGWLVAVLYAVVVIIGIHGFQIHRVPHRMAVFMLILLALALTVGLLFRRRPFCAWVCPVNHLLAAYSHCAPLEWRVRDQQVCRDCENKDCVAGENRDKWHGRACPNNLFPPRLSHNGDCILCTQCLKACPNGNIRWSTRPFLADLFSRAELPVPVVGFVLLVSGFVIYELLTEWAPSKSLLLAAPRAFNGALGLSDTWFAGPVQAVLLFILLPLVLWGLPALVSRAVGGVSSLGAYFQRYALAYIPIAASGHMVKAAQKSISRLGYIAHALADPAGVRTAEAIVSGQTAAPHPPAFLIGPFMDVFAPLVLLLGLGAAVAVVASLHRRHPVSGTIARAMPYFGVVLLGGVLVVFAVLWRLTS